MATANRKPPTSAMRRNQSVLAPNRASRRRRQCNQARLLLPCARALASTPELSATDRIINATRRMFYKALREFRSAREARLQTVQSVEQTSQTALNRQDTSSETCEYHLPASGLQPPQHQTLESTQQTSKTALNCQTAPADLQTSDFRLPTSTPRLQLPVPANGCA
jgi:hypothetical protein